LLALLALLTSLLLLAHTSFQIIATICSRSHTSTTTKFHCNRLSTNAHRLGLESASLAYALQRYCSFTADKKHQLGDWRQRPLPADMLKYAQADTHYLLHVYDSMRCELGSSAAIQEVS
jgi:ribonuclease D